MAGFLSDLIDLYTKEVEKHRNRPFLRAVMAACATISMASGAVTLRERVRVDQVMETLEALRVYDPHEGVDLFNEFVDAIKANPQQGREDALQAIRAEAAAEPDKAMLLIRICLAVSEVDGEIPMAEQIEIVGLCGHLGVPADGLGLYTDGAPKTD